MVALTVVVLGLDHYTGGGVDGEDHVGRYRLVHKHKFIVTILVVIKIICAGRAFAKVTTRFL